MVLDPLILRTRIYAIALISMKIDILIIEFGPLDHRARVHRSIRSLYQRTVNMVTVNEGLWTIGHGLPGSESAERGRIGIRGPRMRSKRRSGVKRSDHTGTVKSRMVKRIGPGSTYGYMAYVPYRHYIRIESRNVAEKHHF